MLAGAAAIFLGTALICAGAWHPGLRRGLTPRRLMLWGGLVFPTVVLTALVAGAFALGEHLLPRTPGGPAIEAIGRQFSWEFRYPGGGSTVDTLHLPAGRDVHLVVTSEDVIHSFWIPRIAGKIDAIPGHRNLVRVRADRPGAYGGVCAEFCGEGHTVMRFRAVAHAPNEYKAALARATGAVP